MTVLVAGATGATGSLLVDQLLQRGYYVRAIVRDESRLPDRLRQNQLFSSIQASMLDLRVDELSAHVQGCDVVASCLGHSPSLNGVFGHPRRLVLDATRMLCKAIVQSGPGKPVKFVLMNSSGVRNREISEKISIPEQMAVGLLRMMLPPHADNEQAAEYLQSQIGKKHSLIDWTIVRPDSLTNEDQVTEYTAFPSPIRSAIFNAGKVSRINVAHFMAELIANDSLWSKWKGQMPVLYNLEPHLPIEQ